MVSTDMSNLVYMYYVSGLTLSCFLCVSQELTFYYSPQISLLGCGQVFVSVRTVYRASSHSSSSLFMFIEVSLFQGLTSTQTGRKKVSCLERCPYFRGVLIEGFHCIYMKEKRKTVDR